MGSVLNVRLQQFYLAYFHISGYGITERRQLQIRYGLHAILTASLSTKDMKSRRMNHSDIQGVSGGIVNILGGGSMDYSE